MTAQLGLSLSSRAALSPPELVRWARVAEDTGFAAVFATETASDAIAMAQAMAQATARITVGTAITNLYWRHPALTAVAARVVAELSGGRFVLGLGTASSAVNQAQLGLEPTPPVATMAEYVAVVRGVLAAGDAPFDHDGAVYRVRGFASATPGTQPVPLLVGALLPAMLRCAGRFGDGALLNLASPAMAARAVRRVREAAEAAGRDAAGVQIACVVACAATGDAAAEASAARQLVATYALHPAAGRLFGGAWDPDEVARVAGALRAGDRDGAAALVDDGFAQSLVVTSDGAQQRLDEYREAGVDLPILFPVPVGGDWQAAIAGAVALVAGGLR